MLSIKNLSKIFYRSNGEANFFYALKDINLDVEDNSFLEIVGKSGSGKTTLLNIISGLLTPDEGEVIIDGKNIFELDDNERSKFRNQMFGIIPQGGSGLQNLTVLENILLPSILYSDTDKHDEALKLLARLDILDLKDSYPNELSGGELRRMAIARALIMDPKIIFADEPTGDLDDSNTKIVLDILKSLQNEGKIIFMVTHDHDALDYATTVYKMDGGILKE